MILKNISSYDTFIWKNDYILLISYKYPIIDDVLEFNILWAILRALLWLDARIDFINLCPVFQIMSSIIFN